LICSILGGLAAHKGQPMLALFAGSFTDDERREMLAMGANLSAFPPFLKGGRGDFGY